MTVAEEPASCVQEFYRGSTVFVTGATGFLGKALVEKLLRSCGDVETIYLLVRSKKGKSVQQRLDDIFEDPVMKHLNSESPKKRLRVSVVAGDVSLPGLGLSDADRTRLKEEVTVVFHVAATVRFDEALPLAAAINVRGTQEILRLAKEMQHLKAFVHVSTAYSQCVHSEIEERFYDAPISPKKLLELTESTQTPKENVERITKLVIGSFPNTYVFTKAVSEELVKEEGAGLPVAIVRPAMVVASVKEPMAGWIDNLYGPTGVTVAAAVGLLRVVHCDEDAEANIVPVDMTVNCMVAAAWDVHTNRLQYIDAPPIYNYVSSADSPISWRRFMDRFYHYGKEVPPSRSIWSYSLRLTRSSTLYFVYKLFLHFLPALIVDSAMIVARAKPRLVHGYRKIHRYIDITSYFSVRSWKFHNQSVHSLWSKLEHRDKELFPFDLRNFDWDKYFYHYVRGVRSHLLKEDISTVPAGKQKWRRLYILHQGVKTILLLALLRTIWWIVTSTRALVNT